MKISIVIPAYNESKRLPLFLEHIARFIKNSRHDYEVIVVDDGSSDDTVKIAESFKTVLPSIEVLRISKNRGKGYAVKRGLLRSTGDMGLFLDADGSVRPEEIEKNLHYLTQGGYDIFVGSRVLTSREQVLEVRWYRKLIGRVFNFCVQTFLFKEIRDTQCGFKMFSRKAIRPLFARSYLKGFGFDIEILYLAHKMGYKVKEGPVSWKNVAGSKVNLLSEPFKMFFNILQIRNWHCTPIRPSDEWMGPNEYRYMYEMEQTHWWFVCHRELAVRLIESLGLTQPFILDVGSGAGANLLAFSQLGEASGVDIADEAIEFSRKRGIKNISKGSGEHLNFPDKTFDVIACLDVLEHTTNPVAVLTELKRVLKDEGRIILQVPAFPILWSQHDEALGHYRRYEAKTLISDLQEAGLTCEKMSHFYFLSFFVVAPIRLARRFLVPKKFRKKSDTTTLPPAFLNELLKRWFKLEMKFSMKHSLPLGTTLYAVVRKSR